MGRPSAEFLAIALAALAVPFGLLRLSHVLAARIERCLPVPPVSTRQSNQDQSFPANRQDFALMKALLSLALGLARTVLWPLYLILLAYGAGVRRLWPRSLGILVSAVLTGTGAGTLGPKPAALAGAPGGWPERYLDVPRPVARQLGRAGRFASRRGRDSTLAGLSIRTRAHRSVGTSARCSGSSRMLVIGFELTVLATCVRLSRGRSPLWEWLAAAVALPDARTSAAAVGASDGGAASAAAPPTSTSRTAPRCCGSVGAGGCWWRRRSQPSPRSSSSTSAATGSPLSVSRSAARTRRLYWCWRRRPIILIGRAISRNAWRWVRPSSTWAAVLTAAVARARGRPRPRSGGRRRPRASGP